MTSIFFLNLFFGLTAVGWVIALTWATSHEQSGASSADENKLMNLSDEMYKLKDLKYQGIITQEEFDAQQKKIFNS